MKSRYIIQLKRNCYWEDILTFWDKRECFITYCNLLEKGRSVRIIEQIVAFV